MWPIFVISLPDQTDRRRQVSAALEALSLSFEFVDAVDGRAKLPPHFEAQIDRKKTFRVLKRPMSDGEYACALSHMSVYERIVRERLEGAIVLEDDAILTPLFAQFCRDEGFRKAELVQLDHSGAYVWTRERCALTTEVIGYRLAHNASLSTGYSITQRGASYILAKARPIYSYADWPCDVTKIKSVVSWPRLVISADPDHESSSLERDRVLIEKQYEAHRRKRRLRDWPKVFRKKLIRRLATRLADERAKKN